MIVSHKHRYIFLKTRKTAGTSIEIALSRYCGPDDIITTLSRPEERERAACGGVGPQNLAYRLRPLRKYSLHHIVRILKGRERLRVPSYYNHIPAAKVRTLVGDQIWNSYYKFTFVRNPWDRLASRYHWERSRQGRDIDMDEILGSKNPDENLQIYTIDGEIAVDRVCRYEALTDELTDVCRHLGIPFDGQLPQAKSGHRPKKQHYRELFTPEQAEIVRQKCAHEIEWFGYEY